MLTNMVLQKLKLGSTIPENLTSKSKRFWPAWIFFFPETVGNHRFEKKLHTYDYHSSDKL